MIESIEAGRIPNLGDTKVAARKLTDDVVGWFRETIEALKREKTDKYSIVRL